MRIVPRVTLLAILLWTAARLPLAAFCAPVVLNRSQTSTAAVSLLSDAPGETVLEMRLGAVNVDSSAVNGETWISLDVAGMGQTSRSGWPELPQTSVWVRGSESSRVEILEDDQVSKTWGRIRPVPEAVMRAARGALSRFPSPEFYSGAVTYPETPVTLAQSADLRGTRVLLITFNPVQFDPSTRECTVHTRLRVRVVQGRSALDRNIPANRATHVLLERLLMTDSGDNSDNVSSSPRILLVTEPQFVGALQPLVDWKRLSGLPVQILVFSQIASNAEELRLRLAQLSDSLPSRPDYLLIVGDVDAVPAFFGVEGSLTDHPYSTLSGSDYLPDISVGRLPCHTALECTEWVDRILSYERDGHENSIPNATVFSSSWARDPQHGITVSTLFESAGLATEQLQEPQSGSLEQLVSSLNAGREWIFYIGHGYPQGWNSVTPVFGNTQIGSLQSSVSSIVISVACGTANINYPGQCLGEDWLAQPDGPLAYFGATAPTPFFYSDTLGLGMARAVFAQGVDRLGLAADLGRLATVQAFPQPPGGLTEETIQQFMLLGDPSMRVYASSPETLAVNYPQSIPVGASQFNVTVQRNGEPVSNADVCVASRGGYYSVRSTNPAGVAEFAMDLLSPTALNVTATASGAIPYLGTANVIPADGAYLQVADVIVVDSVGDGDGMADRSEAGELQIALTNLGNRSSYAGQLQCSSGDPRVQILNGLLAVPPITARDTVWLAAGFPFAVADTASDWSYPLLRFDLMPGGGDTVTSYRALTLHAPALSAMTAAVSTDSASGEEATLTVRIRNIGSDALHSTSIRLTSQSPEINLLDSVRRAPSVNEGETLSAGFRISLPTGLPRGFPFDFTLNVTGDNLPQQTLTGTLRLAQIPCFLYQLDRQPEQVDAIAAALVSLGIESERDTILPADPDRYASVWIFCGIFPNQRVLSGDDGQVLADYLSGGGNCYLEGGDTWAFDPPTALHPLFRIDGLDDGTSNAGPFAGEFGTQYEGCAFAYHGENSFIDQLAPQAGASVMLRNDRPNANYAVCIAYAGDLYRTVGSSVELGAVDDAAYPSTRLNIVSDILEWFGIERRADILPPEIQHRPVRRFPRASHPIPMIADIQDATGVNGAEVQYRVNQGSSSTSAMVLRDGRYQTSLPGALSGDTVFYRIRAEDSTPLHTWAQTAEYACAVGSITDTPYALELQGATRADIAPRIQSGDHCSWSLVSYPDTARMLELHGSAGETISFTTPPFDCSNLSSVRVSFDHYLCANVSCPGSFVRVVGSTDGGQTFPFPVWALSPTEPGSQEGTVNVHNLGWALGQASVTLRFEFRNDWYWRIGNVSVCKGEAPAFVPVTGLTISSVKDQVWLHWPVNSGIAYYRVSASTGGGDFEAIALTGDTLFCDLNSSHYNFRLYKVEIVKSGSFPSTPHPLVVRAADLNWTRKLARRPQ